MKIRLKKEKMKHSENKEAMTQKTFDFSEALRKMKEGKKVKKHNWEKEFIFYDQKRNAFMVTHDGIVKTERCFFICYDILSTDWEEVEE